MANEQNMGVPGSERVAPGISNPNVKLAQYNKNIADELIATGGERALQDAREQERIKNSIIGTSQLAYQKGAQDALGPRQGQDINQYLMDGIKNGTLAPEEAMQAVNSEQVDPRVRQILMQSLNTGSQGLGQIQ